jgi:hypothetical protein
MQRCKQTVHMCTSAQASTGIETLDSLVLVTVMLCAKHVAGLSWRKRWLRDNSVFDLVRYISFLASNVVTPELHRHHAARVAVDVEFSAQATCVASHKHQIHHNKLKCNLACC